MYLFAMLASSFTSTIKEWPEATIAFFLKYLLYKNNKTSEFWFVAIFIFALFELSVVS